MKQDILKQNLNLRYIDELTYILNDDEITKNRLVQLKNLTVEVFDEILLSKKKTIRNHYPRIVYVLQTYNFPPKYRFYFHKLNTSLKTRLSNLPPLFPDISDNSLIQFGCKLILEVITKIYDTSFPPEILKKIEVNLNDYSFSTHDVKKHYRILNGLIIKCNLDQNDISFLPNEQPDKELKITTNLDKSNFALKALQIINKHYELPIEVNLIAVDVIKNEELVPQHIIIEPNYLVDVTAIAKCFKNAHYSSVVHMISKVTPFNPSLALIAGNIANSFLDKAVASKLEDMNSVLKEEFAKNPLQFVNLNDSEVQKLINDCKVHFKVIKKCIEHGFKSEEIDIQDAYIEPSFYSKDYGIQGRLDLFAHPDDPSKMAIIELKSGKIYTTHPDGINYDHLTQLLLYDLMIKSVNRKPVDPRNFILYSKSEDRPLRYSAANKHHQYLSLACRNEIITFEMLLSKKGSIEHSILDDLIPERFTNIARYNQRDLTTFSTHWSALSELERKYLRVQFGFIAREHFTAKVGQEKNQTKSGQSMLWRASLNDKFENYSLLNDLTAEIIQSKDGDNILRFRRPVLEDETTRLSSFRRGDIVILYPGNAAEFSVLHHQVHKCTIVDINDEYVEVKFNFEQINLEKFKTTPLWNIEPDLFDSSFNKLYKNLVDFIRAVPKRRKKVLGILPPEQPNDSTIALNENFTDEQKNIFNAIVNANDYYLLWGPPGTGKTSVIIKNLCRHFALNTDETILVAGYTNRAVDEICRAIEDIGSEMKDHYIRIGSSLSCSPEFVPQLIQEKTKSLNNRKDLTTEIKSKKIVVGTVSGILSKKDYLFKMLNFDRLIIDEASQLLEPYLVQFMAHIPKTVLIGDHKQLPAIVTQEESLTKINDKELNEIGITNLRNSLFERLYRTAQKKKWTWAYGILSRQGRMHQNISSFVNSNYYENKLQILNISKPENNWQIKNNALPLTFNKNQPLQELIAKQSIIYIPTEIDTTDPAFKTNKFEATKILELLLIFDNYFKENNTEIDVSKIGIITPYRAQIAILKSFIRNSKLDKKWHEITVDTVERYQGAGFDFILMSLCTNTPGGVNNLSNLNDEQIDRKLNVAITRARKRFIFLGNQHLIERNNDAYQKLIEFCKQNNSILDT